MRWRPQLQQHRVASVAVSENRKKGRRVDRRRRKWRRLQLSDAAHCVRQPSRQPRPAMLSLLRCTKSDQRSHSCLTAEPFSRLLPSYSLAQPSGLLSHALTALEPLLPLPSLLALIPYSVASFCSVAVLSQVCLFDWHANARGFSFACMLR